MPSDNRYAHGSCAAFYRSVWWQGTTRSGRSAQRVNHRETMRRRPRFLCVEDAQPAGIDRWVLAQYRALTINQQKVYELLECFKARRTSLMDESRSTHPSTARAE